MSCPICSEKMEFVFKNGQGIFECPSCEYKADVEHVEVKI